MNKIIQKAIQTSINLKHLPIKKNRHFSFLVRKNNIVSIGWNNYDKTHPLAFRFGYNSSFIHSELACILNSKKIDKRSYMINIRINKDNKLMLAKPCNCCHSLLLHHGIINVVYSTEKSFEWIKIM